MKEFEIRPKNLFDEYLRLASLDADKYFKNTKHIEIKCPACDGNSSRVFSKHGFSYDECQLCHTLFVNPRPDAKILFDYYKNSESAKYFARTFYKETEGIRREKLWKPKAEMVRTTVEKYNGNCYDLVDIGGGYGIFAEEYFKITKSKITIIEPNPEAATICKEKGFNTIENFLEKMEPGMISDAPTTFVSFELFEHLHNPSLFCKSVFNLMKKNDLFILTTLSGCGLDIRVLWDKSDSISLQHLNFFNPDSIAILFKKIGFEILEIFTPGKLDIDILYNNRDKINDRFWKLMLESSTENIRNEWQNFISEMNMSSHMWIICRHP